MRKKALVILADGFEEIEAIAPIDILKRSGVEVVIAGLSGREAESARGIKIITSIALDEVENEFDALILPGGSLAAENLSKSRKVTALIKDMNNKGKVIAAICASPTVVLAATGVLDGKKATCYPGMEKTFPGSVKPSRKKVVIDGNIVTSKGPGTAFLFGLKLAELLAAPCAAASVKEKMLL